jgi:hypothetical protein
MAGEESLRISKDEIERARLMSEYKYEVDPRARLFMPDGGLIGRLGGVLAQGSFQHCFSSR